MEKESIDSLMIVIMKEILLKEGNKVRAYLLPLKVI
jgi:hypothetical protein